MSENFSATDSHGFPRIRQELDAHSVLKGRGFKPRREEPDERRALASEGIAPSERRSCNCNRFTATLLDISSSYWAGPWNERLATCI
jgi:hypothetical protein